MAQIHPQYHFRPETSLVVYCYGYTIRIYGILNSFSNEGKG